MVQNVTKNSDHIVFVERYNRLLKISQRVVRKLTPNDTEIVFSFLMAGGALLDLELNKVAALLPETASSHDRDHLVLVHLAQVESCLYRNGYCPTGHMIRILAGNYGVAPEEEKQSIVREGFRCVMSNVSSAEELASITPLNRVSDAQYSNLYERLAIAWNCPTQKEMAAKMRTRLEAIHTLLPHHKIGIAFCRVRRDREEPLPLYVRNEIHHPSKNGLAESSKFQQDKRIGYAIMKAWLTEDD